MLPPVQVQFVRHWSLIFRFFTFRLYLCGCDYIGCLLLYVLLRCFFNPGCSHTLALLKTAETVCKVGKLTGKLVDFGAESIYECTRGKFLVK